MNVLPVDRPGVNDHFVRPCCLANQFTASLSHIAPKDGKPIFRNPYNVVLAVPDRMAAAFVALHDPVYTGRAGGPCRLVWGQFCQGVPRGGLSIHFMLSFLVRLENPVSSPRPTMIKESQRAQEQTRLGRLTGGPP